MAWCSKMLLNTKCVFWFSLQLFSVTFLVRRITERGMIKNVYWPLCKVPVICVSLMQVSMHITSQESLKESLWYFILGNFTRNYLEFSILVTIWLILHNNIYIFLHVSTAYVCTLPIIRTKANAAHSSNGHILDFYPI